MIPSSLQFFEEKIEQMERNNQIRYYYISYFNINLLKLVPMEKRGSSIRKLEIVMNVYVLNERHNYFFR